MKQVVQAVDIELSEEETKTLYKAKLIIKELQVNLKKIQVKDNHMHQQWLTQL